MPRLGHYLLANNLRSSLATLIGVLLPWPGNAIAAVIVALVTLQSGVVPGLGLLAWAILPAVAATWKLPQAALLYDISFLVCAFCWFFAALLHKFRNWSRVLEAATVLGAILVVSIYLLPLPIQNFLLGGLEHVLAQPIHQIVQMDKEFFQSFDSISPLLIGGLYMVIALISIIYLMLARIWQFAIFSSQQKHEFYHIRIHRILALAVALIVISTFIWRIEWLISLTSIVLLPFIFGGFSLLLYIFTSSLSGSKSTSSMYYSYFIPVIAALILLFFPKLVLLFMAGIGFIDSWIDFRKLRILSIRG